MFMFWSVHLSRVLDSFPTLHGDKHTQSSLRVCIQVGLMTAAIIKVAKHFPLQETEIGCCGSPKHEF